MFNEQKYVVFKAEEVEKGSFAEPLSEESYFVIRNSDIFGAAALHGYGHLVSTSLETDTLRHFLTDDEREYLRELVDNLVQKAVDWSVENRKIPD